MFAALVLALAWAGGPVEAAPAKSAKQPAAKAAAAKPKAAKSPSTKKLAANSAKRKPAPPTPSAGVTQVADWVTASGDSGELPFMVIDKVAAQVFVFEANGKLRGGASALLGLAQGDGSVPGIGDRKLSAIRPYERTTPAGRFVANYGPAAGKSKVLWVDYATAISIHPVVTSNAKEQRVKRLQSRSPRDNRITYGCINVSAGFYENVVRRTFTGTRGVVYILPETEPLESVFPALGVSHRVAAEPRHDPIIELGTANAAAAGEAASDSVQVGDAVQPAFDAPIEQDTARSLAAGDVASDAFAITDTPPLEPDPFFGIDMASDDTRVIEAQPEPDRVLELDMAAQREADRAISEYGLFGR